MTQSCTCVSCWQRCWRWSRVCVGCRPKKHSCVAKSLYLSRSVYLNSSHSQQMSLQSQDVLRRASWQQRQTIKELELAIESLQRQIILRDLLIKEKDSKLHNYSKELISLRQDKEMVLVELESLKAIFKDCGERGLVYSMPLHTSKLLGKTSLKESKLQRQVMSNSSAKEEYVVEPIRLRKEPLREKQIRTIVTENSELMLHQKKVGTTLAEDFFIIGPDSNDIGIHQEKNPSSDTIDLKPIFLFGWDKNNKNQERKQQILLRAFPDKFTAKKLRSKKYDGDIRSVVEWIPSYNISEGYFVLNLLGDIAHKDNSNKLLSESNANKQLHILCLKLPDIVSFKGRRQGEGDIWIVQKIYAISSYYPFFEIHVRLLVEICRALVFQRMKQLKEGRERFQYLGLQFNVRAFGEQSLLTEMLKSYMNKRPVPSDVYSLSTNSAGTFPSNENLRLCQAAYSSGLLFSNIAYDEFLLILTALLSEKTLILVSQSSTVSSFCAVSLLGIIFPFKYSHTIILNCDENKVDNLIFQSPFPILATITTKEISSLVSQAMETNMRNEGVQFVLFDLDSNSILMDKHLKNELEELVPTPPEELRQEYLKYNPCKAKSLFLPKQMKIVKGEPGQRRSKNKLEERDQLKRLMEEEFMEEMDQNRSKSINWSPNHILVQKFNSFVSQFRHVGSFPRLRKGDDVKQHVSNIKKNLVKAHKNHEKFLKCFLETQIFAQYLDSKLYPS